MTNSVDYWQILLAALEIEKIAVKQIMKPSVLLESGHSIEWERGNLFKLSFNGQVIAPFDDLEELIQFLQADITSVND